MIVQAIQDGNALERMLKDGVMVIGDHRDEKVPIHDCARDIVLSSFFYGQARIVDRAIATIENSLERCISHIVVCESCTYVMIGEDVIGRSKVSSGILQAASRFIDSGLGYMSLG